MIRLPALLLTLACMLAHAQAQSQEFPTKSLRLVVPNGTGSLADTVARLVFARVGEHLGQPIIIDNRAGAAGNIGAEAVAKAAPDGYTLLFATDGILAISPFLYSKLPFDPLKDFSGVSMLTQVPTVVIAHPSLGARTVEDFVRVVRALPDKHTYGSGGNGHATHMGMELFLSKAGLRMTHVPYKGTGPAMQAVITGEVMAAGLGTALVLPHVQSGKVIAIGYGGPRPSAEFMASVPDLEKLIPGSTYIAWHALLAPTGTPAAVITRLNAAVVRALATPDLRGRIGEMGVVLMSSEPAGVERAIRADQAVNRDLVKRLGLKVE